MSKIVAGTLKRFFQLFAKKNQNHKLEETTSEEIAKDQGFLLDLLSPLGDELDLLNGLEELCLKIHETYKVDAHVIDQSSKGLVLDGPWKLTDDHGGLLTVRKIKVAKVVTPLFTSKTRALYELKAFFDAGRKTRKLHSFVSVRD